ncbi:MAG: oxidoreductase [Planctomyces sp.]|nr:oxidoreductase [Planctomyces sp.]
MTTTTSQTGESSGNYRIIGTRPDRADGLDKVTGAAKFGADIQLSGLLHGKILRSPHAHAIIRSIDTSGAEAMPGVMAVATSADFPITEDREIDFAELQGNSRMMADNILANGKVLYKGHAVAAVAAASPHVAEEALSRIKVDYEVLPAAVTLQDALKPDAPVLHENITTMFRVDRFERGEDTGVHGNVAGHIQHKLGDVDKGFREADIVLEREFLTESVHPGYIEPHASTASWSQGGFLTIWTSTQGAFAIRSLTSAILGISEAQVKVIPMEVGGGFGAKGVSYLDPVVAILSRKSGHPVKIAMSRKEVFEGSGPTSATLMRTKIGVTNQGKITAAQVELNFEAGAYPGSPVAGGALSAFGPYNIENLLVDGYDIVCNKQKTGSYRAPGQPQAVFSVEPVIDELADVLGMDPMDFRLLNAVSEGDRMANGVRLAHFGCKEVEEAMKAHPHYTAPLDGPNQGRGVAVGFRFQAGQVSSATINVNNDGTVNITSGSVDLSGTRTTVAMQVAEVLGLELSEVSSSVGDTDSVGYTATSGGSRTAFDTGLAAIATAEEVIRQMSGRAALLWEVQEEDVVFQDGSFVCTKNPEDRLTFKELAGRQMRTGGPLTCSISARSTGVGPILAGNIVDVEVDPETGKVDILRFTAFIDAGRAVHPSFVEGQVQGATVQGIGWALNEEYFFTEDGTMANSSFLDYRMPTSLDVPMIDTEIIEVPNPRHPFGLRGVGEVPIIPPLSALANAVSHATGVRMNRLPLTPNTILETIHGNDD